MFGECPQMLGTCWEADKVCYRPSAKPALITMRLSFGAWQQQLLLLLLLQLR